MKLLNFVVLAILGLACVPEARTAEPVAIGSRRELFVDRFLIDKMNDAKLRLHKPAAREVVLVTNKPWEGNTSGYYTIFQDGGLYRMYYRGWNHTGNKPTHPEFTCYAESKDGIHWTKPNLGIVTFAGSKKNNIIWQGPGAHNFTPFKDANPDCPAEARYKALARGIGQTKRALYALQSADGTHWKLMQEKPVITKGYFDSQNLAFWDAQAKVYREYHRHFRNGVRDIMTGTSKDFLHWTEPEFLKYPGAAKEHLYTNAVAPYHRAPHLLLGFPTRFLPQRGQQTEPIFMASRDGLSFQRWKEALIPVTAPKDRDGNRCNYMAWGMVQLPGAKNELSAYATEGYYRGPDSRLRRFTFRTDGFVSVNAPAGGGEIVTKPISFSGSKLNINLLTAKQGSVKVEIQAAGGKPIPGFALADCLPATGDSVEHIVRWKHGDDVGKLAGKPVRLRFRVKNGDLFAFQFRD